MTYNAAWMPTGERPRPWWKHWWVWVLVGVVAVGIASGVAVPRLLRSSQTTAVGSGYLAGTSTHIIFVQWTNTAGRLSGTAHVTSTNGTAPTRKVSSYTLAVSGRVDGSTIVVRFGYRVEQFGKFTGATFTINFPNGKGSLLPLTFHSTETQTYDQRVARLQSRVASANAQAHNHERIVADEGAVDHALHVLNAALADLTTIRSKLPALVAAVRTALTKETAALTQTRAALSAASATHTATSVCTAADTVRTDADAVSTAADAVRTAVRTVERYLTTSSSTGLRQVMAEITPDVVALHNAGGAVPQFQPPQVPSPTAIHQALAAATSAGASAVSAVNALVTTANNDIDAADAAASQALAARSCGAAPSATHLTALSW